MQEGNVDYLNIVFFNVFAGRNGLLSPESAPRSNRSPTGMSPAKRQPLVGETQVLSEGQQGQGDRKKNGFQNWLQARKTDSNNFMTRNGKGV